MPLAVLPSPCRYGRVMVWILTILASTCLSMVRAEAIDDDPSIGALDRFFEAEVRPLLVENCVGCHGAEEQKGGLRLDTREGVLAGGESGPVIEPGRPEESLLIEAVRHDGLRMPPKRRLADAEVHSLEKWIEQGARWPVDPRDHSPAVPGRELRAKPGIAEEEKAWWAFQPRSRPEPPSIERETWSRNPIDRFLLAKLEAEKLKPAPEADRVTLIRRLTFDLTGLPPTPEEVSAFVADDRPEAYERLVDRLLSSPAYGERWARHWLDLARYAESDGYRQDAFRPGAWRYRDWVIAAFNQDMPFDRFTEAQLAGDEIDGEATEMRVATTFLRLGPYEFNQRDVAGQRAAILNELTDTVGDVFMGMGIGCARCHDHKFDPILQEDYYRIQGFFAAVQPRDDLAVASEAELAKHALAVAEWESRTAELRSQIAELERPFRAASAAEGLARFQPEFREMWSKPDADRTPYERQITYLMQRQFVEEFGKFEALVKGREKVLLAALYKKLESVAADRPQPLPMALAVTDVGPVAPPNVIPGDRRERDIAPGFLSVLDANPAAIETIDGATTTGRRTTFARWLTQSENPLTPRVMANRLWQYHFGRGLSATSSDFGHLGEVPSHPELLDWLASELIEQDWSLKAMHRLMVTSAAYRQGSQVDPEAIERSRRLDPENRWLWERSPRRLEAEAARDAMLATSGELNLGIGGASVEPAVGRRSVYLRQLRNSPVPLLMAFDAPDGSSTTPERNQTTTATQALTMVNGAWTLARAEAFARRLGRDCGEDCEARIERAFRLALGREPSAAETEAVTRFLGNRPREVAWVDFCHALLNSNAFLFVD